MISFKEKIKEYFKFKNLTSSTCKYFLKINDDVRIEVQKILNEIPEYQTLHQVVKYILNDEDLPKCIKCGNYIDATKATALKRCGGNYFCKKCLLIPGIKREIGLNALPKFKRTMLERYGVEFSAKSKELNKKREETCLKKYGTKYAQSAEIVKNKIKETLNKKFGVENIMKVSKLETLKNFEKYLISLFDTNEYLNDTNRSKKNYRWKCKRCGNVFEPHIHKTMNVSDIPYLPRCWNCFPLLKGESNQEFELTNFIKEIYKGEILENDRNVIKPYELDIVIPEKKIAFEFNGSFWHSERSPGFNGNKCLMKTEMCNKVNYKLIHIWEYDWINPIKQNILKEKIKAILGVDQTKIYARKCIIKEIDSKTKNEFLNLNHIQGEDKSKIKLGLYYENELVAVMTFGKPRFNKKYEYELIRYATKSGFHVLGGAGKLLKYFEKTYKPKSIITYADRSYSKGNMYRKIGFNELKPSSPNYLWVRGNEAYSRYQCQKHKLKNILGDKFDPNLTESENMALTRFLKIYDCGNLVFEKIINYDSPFIQA